MESNKNAEKKVKEITNVAKKRGFFFQTAEIYGGKAGFFSYGHLGKLMKNKFENIWRSYFLKEENFYEIQSNNILPEKVFIASGHLKNFNDPMTECEKCHFRFRADQFLEDAGFDIEGKTIEEMTNIIKKNKLKCPRCGGNLSDVKWFNMMFSINIGINEERGYLSPETAQGAYISFLEEFEATRKKLPLGLAIIDKAYRNEISPRQLFFRLREFTQAELQIFFDPEEINKIDESIWEKIKNEKIVLKLAKEKKEKETKLVDLNEKQKIPKFYLLQIYKINKFYHDILKIPKDKFRFRELSEEERAFYNKIHFDIEIYLESLGGWREVAGLHYRTDHDLKGHEKISSKSMKIFWNNKKFIPHVIELSFGIDRNIWALLDIFCYFDKEHSDTLIFKFPPRLSPIEVAIFPLVNKEDMDNIAKKIYEDLKENFNCFYDDSGSIGRRYARQDEIGTPFCITVDGETLKNETVTIRDRDTKQQIRVKVSQLKEILENLINEKIKFKDLIR